MARRDVPFGGGAETGIDVDTAFRDPAELHRRAELGSYCTRPPGDEALGPAVAMGAADSHRPGLAAWRARPGTDRLDGGDRVVDHRQALGAVPDQPAPDQAQRRRADEAEQRLAVAHQCEVDRELVAAGDELLGAVERIDQEKAAAIGWRRLMQTLFGQRGDLRYEPCKAIGDDAVGREIGFRHG